jgi:DNA-binding transcriptional ArsR family regulator
MASADLLLHPVRLRVVQALLGGRTLSTADLARELTDVPAASLYRHVSLLLEAGVIEVAEERRVRGAVERCYRLRATAASVEDEHLAAMGPDEHRAAFTAFAAGLLADFDRYLESGDIDLVRDGVGYRHYALHLSDTELRDLVRDLSAVLLPRLELRPRRGRRRRMLSTILMPADQRPTSA